MGGYIVDFMLENLHFKFLVIYHYVSPLCEMYLSFVIVQL